MLSECRGQVQRGSCGRYNSIQQSFKEQIAACRCMHACYCFSRCTMQESSSIQEIQVGHWRLMHMLAEKRRVEYHVVPGPDTPLSSHCQILTASDEHLCHDMMQDFGSKHMHGTGGTSPPGAPHYLLLLHSAVSVCCYLFIHRVLMEDYLLLVHWHSSSSCRVIRNTARHPWRYQVPAHKVMLLYVTANSAPKAQGVEFHMLVDSVVVV